MCDQKNIMLEMFKFCFKNRSTNILVPYHVLDYDDYVQNSQSHYKQWTFHLLSLGKYTQNKMRLLGYQIKMNKVCIATLQPK